FKRGNAPFEHRVGRIADAAVAEAVDFEVEQRGAVIRAVEGVSHGLIDRHGHRLGRGLDLVAAVNGDGLASHAGTWTFNGQAECGGGTERRSSEQMKFEWTLCTASMGLTSPCGLQRFHAPPGL